MNLKCSFRNSSRLVYLIAVILCLYTAQVYGLRGKDSEGSESEPEKAQKAEKIPSKDEMTSVIKKRLKTFPSIIDMTPGLSVKENAQSVKEYYYAAPGGVLERLEDLGKDILYKLYVSINRQATIMNTKRITDQLKQQEQLERLRNLQTIPQAPPQVPVLPPMPAQAQGYVPVQVPPTAPQVPPEPPRAEPQRR